MKDCGFLKFQRKEAAVMKILWESKNALTVYEIGKKDTSGVLSGQNAHITIRSLLAKEMIQVDFVELVGRTYVRKFKPSISAETYGIQMSKCYFKQYSNRSADEIIFTVLEEAENPNETLNYFEKALIRYKENKITSI